MFTRSFFPSASPFNLRNPFGDLQRLRQEFDQLLEGAWRPAAEYPALNVWTSPEAVAVTAELPGFEPSDIEVSVVQNVLTLRGSRPASELKEDETYHRRERWSGKFVRSLELPFPVDGTQVEAQFKNGVLAIKLPRAEEHRPRKIEIKAA